MYNTNNVDLEVYLLVKDFIISFFRLRRWLRAIKENIKWMENEFLSENYRLIVDFDPWNISAG